MDILMEKHRIQNRIIENEDRLKECEYQVKGLKGKINEYKVWIPLIIGAVMVLGNGLLSFVLKENYINVGYSLYNSLSIINSSMSYSVFMSILGTLAIMPIPSVIAIYQNNKNKSYIKQIGSIKSKIIKCQNYNEELLNKLRDINTVILTEESKKTKPIENEKKQIVNNTQSQEVVRVKKKVLKEV